MIVSQHAILIELIGNLQGSEGEHDGNAPSLASTDLQFSQLRNGQKHKDEIFDNGNNGAGEDDHALVQARGIRDGRVPERRYRRALEEDDKGVDDAVHELEDHADLDSPSEPRRDLEDTVVQQENGEFRRDLHPDVGYLAGIVQLSVVSMNSSCTWAPKLTLSNFSVFVQSKFQMCLPNPF